MSAAPLAQAESDAWFVYLVRCGDGTLYCGIAKDVAARVQAHGLGKGAKYTRGRHPVALAWTSPPQPSRSEATRLERRIKKLPRPQKLLLCTRDATQT